MWTDGQTDMMKLIVVFCNFSKAPKMNYFRIDRRSLSIQCGREYLDTKARKENEAEENCIKWSVVCRILCEA